MSAQHRMDPTTLRGRFAARLIVFGRAARYLIGTADSWRDRFHSGAQMFDSRAARHALFE